MKVIVGDIFAVGITTVTYTRLPLISPVPFTPDGALIGRRLPWYCRRRRRDTVYPCRTASRLFDCSGLEEDGGDRGYLISFYEKLFSLVYDTMWLPNESLWVQITWKYKPDLFPTLLDCLGPNPSPLIPLNTFVHRVRTEINFKTVTKVVVKKT